MFVKGGIGAALSVVMSHESIIVCGRFQLDCYKYNGGFSRPTLKLFCLHTHAPTMKNKDPRIDTVVYRPEQRLQIKRNLIPNTTI